MPVRPEFREFILEQLRGGPRVTWRAMFGGVGLYRDGAFFGVVDDDVVYFRVNDATRPRYQSAGSRPFAPMADEKPMMGYFEVPAEILDDRERFGEWADEAARVAEEAKKKGKEGKKGREGRDGKDGGTETVGREAKTVSWCAAMPKGTTPADIVRSYPPKVRRAAVALRKVVRAALPGTEEVPYSGWHAIGYRDADTGLVCTIFPQEIGVRLYLERGAKLDDPDGVLTRRLSRTACIDVPDPRAIRVRPLRRLLGAARLRAAL